MSRTTYFLFISLLLLSSCSLSRKLSRHSSAMNFFPAKHELLRYTGRIDTSIANNPRWFQPGIYMEGIFRGSECRIIVKDQQLGGNNQNYLQIVVDGESRRIQTKGSIDTITIASGLKKGLHSFLICKNTEANIGWISIEGLLCEALHPLPPAPLRKIEFIGNSITCGTGADTSGIPCGKGVWQDQHNAYMSYGPLTARALDAQWHLSSVSGIGIIRSCCEMPVLMPMVYDKINMYGDSLIWDASVYQPDVITICLGQNDGIQDSTAFCSAYVDFIQQVNNLHPQATIICLSSPMANAELLAMQQSYLPAIVAATKDIGFTDIHSFFFSKRYHNGCDEHPNLEEHEQMAEELTDYIKRLKAW